MPHSGPVGIHRRQSWHVTPFPVVAAGLGVAALVAGLVVSRGHSDGAKPSDAQRPPAASAMVLTPHGTPSAGDSPVGDVSAPAEASATEGTVMTTAAASAPRVTASPAPPKPTATAPPSSAIHLPTVRLPTFR